MAHNVCLFAISLSHKRIILSIRLSTHLPTRPPLGIPLKGWFVRRPTRAVREDAAGEQPPLKNDW